MDPEKTARSSGAPEPGADPRRRDLLLPVTSQAVVTLEMNLAGSEVRSKTYLNKA